MSFARLHRNKALTTAILLLGVAANAQADINPGTAASGSSGQLFLDVWDQTQSKSYTLNLGVTVDQLLSNPAAVLAADTSNGNFALGSSFASMYQTGDVLDWNLAAASKYDATSSADYGIIVSNVPGSTQETHIGNTVIQSDASKIGSWAVLISEAQDYYNNQPTTGNYSQLLSEVSLSSTVGGTGILGNTTYYGASATWGNTLDGIIGNGSATATPSQSLQLLFYGDTSTSGGNNATVLGNGLTFALNPEAGTLSFTSAGPLPGSALPLPGAVWLFLSAALSVLGLQRGKRASC